LWEREIPDLDLLRASKKQERTKRKKDIERERKEKANNAELKRLEKATARASMPKHKRDMENCLNTLPQTWKKGARKIKRVQDEMSTIWRITERIEFEDREVTELFKIRYMPENQTRGVPSSQYHALQMTTQPGEKGGTMVKKTVLLKRLTPM
jgi:hypothetical protein